MNFCLSNILLDNRHLLVVQVTSLTQLFVRLGTILDVIGHHRLEGICATSGVKAGTWFLVGRSFVKVISPRSGTLPNRLKVRECLLSGRLESP